MNGFGALWLAFGAGLISFLSPCTLPLLPGYLSYISGVGADEVGTGEKTGTLVTAALFFVVGFSLIFVALGATASYVGASLAPYRDTLTRLSGVFIIVMALVMIGVFRLPMLAVDRRFHLEREWGMWSAFPLGMAFAFGWSPCIGPTLASILAYAGTEGTAQRGALLLFVYSLGLGAPFLLVALFAGRILRSLGPVKRHLGAISRTGGALLLVMGIFLATNQWTQFLAPAMRWYAGLHLPS